MKITGLFKNRETKLYYRIIGKGKQPIVMVHGNGENHTVFAKLVKALAKNYTLILADSRGHGKSGIGREELTTELMASDIHKLICELNLKNAVLLGFSDGANAAIQAAVSYPENIAAIIAVSGNINPTGLELPLRLGIKLMYYFCLFLEKLHLPARRSRELMGLMALHPNITFEELNSIKIPVLILTGTRDIIKPEHSIEMGDMIPNATVKILQKSGHFSMFRHSQRYTDIILQYLKENNF